MSGVSRNRFDGQFANTAIDLTDEGLGVALKGTSLSPRKLDALDGKVDGRVSGQRALDDLYDQINRLDTHTAGLSSKSERAVWTALRGAAIAPAPISSDQGAELAAAARQLVVEDQPVSGTPSQWARKGTSTCTNPAVSSPSYAGPDAWKCNVFVGEAFHRAGLPFPINDQAHYPTANRLPAQSGVQRGPNGQVASISSTGAHEGGSAEGTGTAAPLLMAGRQTDRAATLSVGAEVYRILRPMAPPAAGGK